VTNPQLKKKLLAIKNSELSIYDRLHGRPDLFLTIDELETALAGKLIGLPLGAYPIRTRSKVFKSAVCEALGYPVPTTFQKTQPRFPGQDFDTYVQKSNNLQIWNEEISPLRRYVIARPDANGIIRAVRVLTGEALAKLDKTGTLTKKYQARRKAGHKSSALLSTYDTNNFAHEFAPANNVNLSHVSPTDRPSKHHVLSVKSLYAQLMNLVGTCIPDPGQDQERNRGAGLQRAICAALNLKDYADKGQWPDILSQALEVKLQTSPTIDLGLVSPDGEEPAQEVGTTIRHCDVRYAIFYGDKQDNGTVKLTSVVISTGEDFFREFDKFGGLIVNAKLQIPLPRDFFD
jgi:hypothetical protein